jgi:hypothetical protein
LVVVGRFYNIGSGCEYAESKAEIFKTLLSINHEFKSYMELFIEKLPTISTASESFLKPHIDLVHSSLPKYTKSDFGFLITLEVNHVFRPGPHSPFKLEYLGLLFLTWFRVFTERALHRSLWEFRLDATTERRETSHNTTVGLRMDTKGKFTNLYGTRVSSPNVFERVV